MNDLLEYALFYVDGGEEGYGYLAIGFVEDRNGGSQVNERIVQGKSALVSVKSYNNGTLQGKAIHVLSGSKKRCITRLRNLGSGRLTHLAEETFLELDRIA